MSAHHSPVPARVHQDVHQQRLVRGVKAMPASCTAPASCTTPAPASIPPPRQPSTLPVQTSYDKATLPPPPLPSVHQPPPRTDRLPSPTTNMGKASAFTDALPRSATNSSPLPRPTTPRAQTDSALDNMSPYSKPRNRSPYSRSHLCSHSPPSPLSAPPMTRAHSLPTVMHPQGQLSFSPSPCPHGRPLSPLRSPKRTRSPRGLDTRTPGIRPATAGASEGAPTVCDISEDAELELTPRSTSTFSTLYSTTGSLSRRRRPASPLHHTSVPFGPSPTSNPMVGTPSSMAFSPLFAPSKFNEHYPTSLPSSSISSTPTSARSRSPSISSLETIEDSPDAEEKASEEQRIAQLKAAADCEDDAEQRRSSLDMPDARGRGFGNRDSRKRWSVCGAERRQDLDLETIWED